MVRDHPKRFGLLAILPLPHIELTLGRDPLRVRRTEGRRRRDDEQLRRRIHRLAETFWPVFEELNRRKAVVFFHPVAPQDYRGFPGVSLSTMEFPFDTARAIMSMLYHGTPEKFPDVTMIFSHAGGAMPYLAGRTAVLSQRNKEFKLSGDKLMPAMAPVLLRRHAVAERADLCGAARAGAAEQLLFGSDCPFAKEPQVRAVLAELDRLALPPAERVALERGNALSLFPRFK